MKISRLFVIQGKFLQHSTQNYQKNTNQKYTGSFREHLSLPLDDNNVIKKNLVRNHIIKCTFF